METIKLITKVAMKGFMPGDTVELEETEAKRLLGYGYVEPLPANPADEDAGDATDVTAQEVKDGQGEKDDPEKPAGYFVPEGDETKHVDSANADDAAYADDATAEVESDEESGEYPRHTGGGWYELSNGETVRGQDDAVQAENNLKEAN